MSATEPEIFMFQKQRFPTKELRDTYVRGFIAGLKAKGDAPVDLE